MEFRRDRLRAGAPLVLPSGMVLVAMERTRMVLRDVAGWRSGFVRREPCALVLRAADGSLRVLAAGAEPVSIAALRQAGAPLEHAFGGSVPAVPR